MDDKTAIKALTGIESAQGYAPVEIRSAEAEALAHAIQAIEALSLARHRIQDLRHLAQLHSRDGFEAVARAVNAEADAAERVLAPIDTEDPDERDREWLRERKECV
jgi:predicted FMN-binding regulatory protein PaiB